MQGCGLHDSGRAAALAEAVKLQLEAPVVS